MSEPRTVWKYPLMLGVQSVQCPIGAVPLTVQDQLGALCLWMLCDPTQILEARRVAVVGTGHPAPSSGYVGTVQQAGGTLIWHVFMERS